MRLGIVLSVAAVPVVLYLQWIGSDLAWVVCIMALLIVSGVGAK